MQFEYTHYGRCFMCNELTGLNENTLMCETHDYERIIDEHVRDKLTLQSQLADMQVKLNEARRINQSEALLNTSLHRTNERYKKALERSWPGEYGEAVNAHNQEALQAIREGE